MDQTLRGEIEAGSEYADTMKFQSAEYSYMHAMSSSALSKEAAMNKWCDFIREKMNDFNSDKNSRNPRNRKTAYFNLGMGLHAVMDSTSPAHRGFQEWNWTDAFRHGDIPGTIENYYSSLSHVDETVGVINQVMSGKLPVECQCR